MSEAIVAEESRLLVSGFELAVDVGASDGSWSSYLSAFFKSVVAIEPDWRSASLIPQIASVEVIRAMAGSAAGTAELYLRSHPRMNSAYKVHPVATPGGAADVIIASVSCNMVTLDDVCNDGADFVKVDTEGYEHEVLRGCQDVARWCRTVFVIEVHANEESVLAELQRLGKSVVSRIENNGGTHKENFWVIAK